MESCGRSKCLSIVLVAILIGSVNSPGQSKTSNPDRKPRTTRVKQERQSLPPKSIILDKSPTIADPASRISRKAADIVQFKDYCPGNLFCPDIDEIDYTLRQNVERFSKGKFEKTVDYERRLNNVLNSIPLGTDKTAGEQMVFLYEEHSDPSYDADSEKWTFDLDLEQSGGLTCVTVFSEKTGDLLCAMVKDQPRLAGRYTVRMPPAAAKANDGQLKIAVVGKIVAPYIWNYSTGSWGSYAGIHFDVSDVICLNPQTGQLWKVEHDTPGQVATLIPPSEPKPVAPETTITDTPSVRIVNEPKRLPSTLKSVVSEVEGQILVRSTFDAIAIGLQEKNFSRLHEQFSSRLQLAVTPSQVGKGLDNFAKHRKTFTRLFQAAGTEQISFDTSPTVETLANSDFLRLKGRYISSTYVGSLVKVPVLATVIFNFAYIKENRVWRLMDYQIETR